MVILHPKYFSNPLLKKAKSYLLSLWEHSGVRKLVEGSLYTVLSSTRSTTISDVIQIRYILFYASPQINAKVSLKVEEWSCLAPWQYTLGRESRAQNCLLNSFQVIVIIFASLMIDIKAIQQ